MNYYEILHIQSNATSLEIKQAYRKLVKEFHPDSQHKNSNHDHIIKLNAAYEVLSDEKNRHIYDQKLRQKFVNSVNDRQDKSYNASQYYQQNRRQQKQDEFSQFRWLKEVYFPVYNLINGIISPLEMEIEDLSADLFDDHLMSVFTNYLDDSRKSLEKAKIILTSQPNPSLYAGIAANLYYGLNHIIDGIEELERFTQTYDDYYLHTGRELFNLAEEISHSAAEMAEKFN
ncbi:J domain-containing protein [Geminocystis sp. NIES-3709]|uniref:J domain-containing protein n=1 Tax=Geminocystis sp. NIES-3709 TaxID=1617448 RepID=UPI0005FCB562|nr:DnaJ domain-containing protein [Geminocystis sp. NIES-3709]BAQ63271.1 chaperone protein DnaJ [Geminocystis sp. NIES-3709]